MRAIYFSEDIEKESFIIEGESFHHLINVVRLKVGDDLLILNGKGSRFNSKVVSINKKNLIVSIQEKTIVKRNFNLDLALGVPKKEALELSLKIATEIGIKRIFLIESDFSNLRNIEASRLSKMLVTALEQSNSSYIPELISSSWKNLPYEDYDLKLRLDSVHCGEFNVEFKRDRQQLLIIGPEGGFSQSEIDFFKQNQEIKTLNLPTGILRTPTAIAVGSGWVLKGLMN